MIRPVPLLLSLLLVGAPLALATPAPPTVFGNPPTSGTLLAECHQATAAGSCTVRGTLPFFWNNLRFHASSCGTELEGCSTFTGRVRFTYTEQSDGGTDGWDMSFVNGVWTQGVARSIGDGRTWGATYTLTMSVLPYPAGAVPGQAFVSGNPGGSWHAWVTATEGTPPS